MLNMKLKGTGTLKMQSGAIDIKGFEADGATCREVAILSLVWAIGELNAELTHMIERPGGTGMTSVD